MLKKYERIDFKHPKGVAEQAERGLRLRAQASPANKGGLSVSQAKADPGASWAKKVNGQMDKADKEISRKVDKVANLLESRGFLKYAFMLDEIADSIDKIK